MGVTRDARLPSPRPVALLATAMLATLAGVALGACSPDEDSAAESGCAATVKSASLAVEVDEQVALLDRALLRCRSLAELTSEMQRYPGIVGYELPTFVELRCSRVTDEAVRSSPACAAVIATTTVAATAPSEVVFVGDTLDGRRIEIRPDADTVFVGDLPQAMQQTVDIALESGCEGVIAQRDLWAARTSDPVIGDEASVYANHAQSVAAYIGCEAVPLPTTVPG